MERTFHFFHFPLSTSSSALTLLVAGIGTHDVLPTLAAHAPAFFTPEFDGGSDFHGLSGLGGRRSRGSGLDELSLRIQTGVVRTEPIDDAPLLQVVGGHLQLDAVAGKDPYFVHPHASGQVAEELVILGFFRGDADAERCVRVAFFDDANEFDNILRHVGILLKRGEESREILQMDFTRCKA